MFRYLFCIVTFVLVSFGMPGSLSAQKSAGKLSPAALNQLKAGEDTLLLLAYTVVNDSLEKHRFAACRTLITNLVRLLKVENSFKYPFNRLKSLSILAPPDSSFRIFTWQLFVNDSTYRYYGAVQLNRSELALTPLIDRSFEYEDLPLRQPIAPDKWFGALYYNLRQFDTKEGRKYLLFGYQVPSFFERRKILDVITINPDGKPVFGGAVFERDKLMASPEMRLVLQYSADASVRLNWDEQYQLVLFDHLIEIPNPYRPGFTSVPDGSYEGFKLEKGRWKHIDKVFNDVMNETPRPEPILDQRKENNILGKPKKNDKK